MNNIVKIILISLTFVATLLLGFFIMSLFPFSEKAEDGEVLISKVAKTDDNQSDLIAGNQGKSFKLHAEGDAEEGYNQESDDPEYDYIEPANPAEPADDVKPEQRRNQEEPNNPKQDSSTTPEIKSVYVAGRSSAGYEQVGLNCVASASTESGDNLLYELFETGSNKTAKYQSQTGTFVNVIPVDSGKYLLKVTNTRTGDFATKEISGFDKINKYSAAELQKQLNSDTQEKLFYHHFDLKGLKFDCEGADASDGIGALLEKREALGWVLTVVGTPRYDEYNRITYFKVKVD